MQRYRMWRLAAWKGKHLEARRHGKVQDVEASGRERYSMWRLAAGKGTVCGG